MRCQLPSYNIVGSHFNHRLTVVNSIKRAAYIKNWFKPVVSFKLSDEAKHEYRRVNFPRGRGKLALLAGHICIKFDRTKRCLMRNCEIFSLCSAVILARTQRECNVVEKISIYFKTYNGNINTHSQFHMGFLICEKNILTRNRSQHLIAKSRLLDEKGGINNNLLLEY